MYDEKLDSIIIWKHGILLYENMAYFTGQGNGLDL